MKNSITTALGILFTAGLLISAHPLLANTEFDGTWSAKAYTSSGPCKRQYSFKVEIAAGIVSGSVRGQQGSYKLDGVVNDDGTTTIGLIGPDEGEFIGQISDDKAKGKWESRNCRGTFKLKKKT